MKKLELKNTNFTETLEKFRIRLKVQGASQDQQYIKTNIAKEFLYFMEQNGKTKLKQINQKLVNKYFEYLKTRPTQTKVGFLSDGSINKHREAVLRFIEFSMGLTGVEVKNGMSGIKIKFIKTKSIPIEILTEEEVEEVFKACDETVIGIRDKAIVSLLYGCGLRKGEVLSLDVEDIDLNKSRIHLDKTKTKYSRDVPMTKKVQEHIENYLFNVRNMMLDSNSNENKLIITTKGTAMKKSTLATVMKRLSLNANINKKLNCHLFRHSIGTHLHRYLKLEDVATFLGHRCLDSTMIYTHLKNKYYG